MLAMKSAFPNFADGDVKVILSEDPADTLMLHTSVLAKDSPFFKASLERLDWCENKYIIDEGTNRQLKLLVLDFEDGDSFPLLISSTSEPSPDQLTAKRSTYDEASSKSTCSDLSTSPAFITRKMHNSSLVLCAYKIGFALVYGIRISIETLDIVKLSAIIPAVVEFADAYGLLPALTDRVNSLPFGHKWNAYDVLACNPFHMLRVSCKLESEEIYREAMKHAVAVHHQLSSGSANAEFGRGFFAEVGDDILQAAFDEHVRSFSQAIDYLHTRLLKLNPHACEKIGMAKRIGASVYRDWIVATITGHKSNHAGILDIRSRSYDVSSIMKAWDTNDWHNEVGLRFGHVHRAVESCFGQAEQTIKRTFSPSNDAKGEVPR